MKKGAIIAIVVVSLTIIGVGVTGILFLLVPSNTNGVSDNPIEDDVPKPFISTWNCTKISSGSSAVNQVKLPLEPSGTYNFVVDWGDGTNNTITSWNQSEITHTYLYKGQYDIEIRGTIIGWCFDHSGDRLKILNIKQWGCLRLGNSGRYFYGCNNMYITANDLLDLTGTIILDNAFTSCYGITTIPRMNDWDTSKVTSMRGMFYFATEFDQDIGDWNVSNVINMRQMFTGASSFNQDISGWDVSSVIEMSFMFYQANSFNQSIGEWDVLKVNTMESMFREAHDFDQNIGNWNITRVTKMVNMFLEVNLSMTNYNALLVGWEAQDVQDDVMFHGGYSQYFGHPASVARNNLIIDHNWNIEDGNEYIPPI